MELPGLVVKEAPVKGTPFEGVKTADEMANLIAEIGESSFARFKEVRPTAILVAKENIFVLATEFRGEQAQIIKEAFGKLIDMTAAMVGAHGVGFVSECWAIANKDPKDYEGKSLEHVPGRTEIIMATATWKGKKACRVSNIIRGADGSVQLLRDDRYADVGEIKGRFSFDTDKPKAKRKPKKKEG